MTNGEPGPGVDARGYPVRDPTENVYAILEAAVKRIDDVLYAAIQRQDDMREAESRHVQDISKLRAEYAEQLRRAEAERIDAIRAVDVGAVNRAAEVATAQANTLAAQVATSAETLRTQVAAAATAATTALAAALDPIQKDIADLRKAQYEQQGQKAQVSETQASSTGSRQWIGLAIAAAVGAGSLLLAIAGIVVALLLRHPAP